MRNHCILEGKIIKRESDHRVTTYQFSAYVERCRDGSEKKANWKAVYRQDRAYKDYPSDPIPTSHFCHLHNAVSSSLTVQLRN